MGSFLGPAAIDMEHASVRQRQSPVSGTECAVDCSAILRRVQVKAVGLPIEWPSEDGSRVKNILRLSLLIRKYAADCARSVR